MRRNSRVSTLAATGGAIVAIAAPVLVGSLAAADASSGSASAAAVARSGDADGDRAAIRDVIRRKNAAYSENDANAFASQFTRRTQFVIGEGTLLEGRAKIRAFLRTGFAGFLKGTRAESPITNIRFLEPDMAVVHTRGGILFPGETQVAPERVGVQVHVMTKRRGTWRVAVYQNTRVCEGGPTDPDLVCGESRTGQAGG